MVITQLAVENYKSLRSISLAPSTLSVVVGANAAGKSNLADFIDFVSEVYQHGLEVAVARKGGFENVAHRKERRSTGAVEVRLVAQYNFEPGFTRPTQKPAQVIAKHEYSFRTHGSSIRAEFHVERELLEFHASVGQTLHRILTIRRDEQSVTIDASSSKELRKVADTEELTIDPGEVKFLVDYARRLMSPTELIVNGVGRVIPIVNGFSHALGRIRVFQITPAISREFGVPTPGPELDRSGHNLPAVVDLLQKKHQEQWLSIMEGMNRILPELTSIDVTYSSSRTLGLQFHERGVGRPWNVAEMSDGTMQTLALLVALFDPRSSGIVLEEPENSIHPWIIRTLLSACSQAAKTKQILITTHSPIVMNAVTPEQVIVMWRKNGASMARPLTSLDPAFKGLWEAGAVPTFDYLDTGVLPEAVPPAPGASD